jgi:DNA repair exonuclease SbcCD ATPase subunit
MTALVVALGITTFVLIILLIVLGIKASSREVHYNSSSSLSSAEKQSYINQITEARQINSELTERLKNFERVCGSVSNVYKELEKLQTEKRVLTESIKKEKETIEKERKAIEEERLLHHKDSENRIKESNIQVGVAAEALERVKEETSNLKEQEKELDNKIKVKLAELDSLAETYKAAILAAEKDNINIDENGFEVAILPQYEKMVKLLRELGSNYPELAVELSKIEWSKVWISQFQQKIKAQSWQGGCIYRLILKENPNICYVGQARDVKDRWYQHAKKMLGVEAKGNERLYNYHPEDFIWTVIEDKVDSKDLNNKEHYWINHYACLSVGLNKRK